MQYFIYVSNENILVYAVPRNLQYHYLFLKTKIRNAYGANTSLKRVLKKCSKQKYN